MLWHLSDAWARRREPNVVLVHYDDLSADLEGETRRLAARLGITVAEARWAQFVEAARFERMRARADQLAPDPVGVLEDRGRFFRRGPQGQAESCCRTTSSTTTAPAPQRWRHRSW